jgi:hypothetical protein
MCIVDVGIEAYPAFNAQECTKKSLTTDPLGNTYKVDEVSSKVEAGVVAGLKYMQPYLGQRSMIIALSNYIAWFIHQYSTLTSLHR